jgi:hypothetical protein
VFDLTVNKIEMCVGVCGYYEVSRQVKDNQDQTSHVHGGIELLAVEIPMAKWDASG